MVNEPNYVSMFALYVLYMCLIPTPANANDKAPESPPELGIATVVDKHRIEIKTFSERTMMRLSSAPVSQGVIVEVTQGTIENAAAPDVVQVPETQITHVDASKVILRRITNDENDINAVMKELSNPTPVIILRYGQQINPSFKKMFKPDSIVIELPKLTSPAVAFPTQRSGLVPPSKAQKGSGQRRKP